MSPEVTRWTGTVRTMNPWCEYMLWTERNFFLNGYNIDELKVKYGSWAAITNYLRLMLVYHYGGIFCDTDVMALKPFDELLNHNAFAAFQDQIDGGRICNAIFGAISGHPWLKWQIDHADQLTQDAATGPYLMTAAPRDDLEILPTEVLYPWHWDSPKELRVPKPQSITAHYWLGSWVKK